MNDALTYVEVNLDDWKMVVSLTSDSEVHRLSASAAPSDYEKSI